MIIFGIFFFSYAVSSGDQSLPLYFRFSNLHWCSTTLNLILCLLCSFNSDFEYDIHLIRIKCIALKLFFICLWLPCLIVVCHSNYTLQYALVYIVFQYLSKEKCPYVLFLFFSSSSTTLPSISIFFLGNSNTYFLPEVFMSPLLKHSFLI
jgi:hypothetical protein